MRTYKQARAGDVVNQFQHKITTFPSLEDLEAGDLVKLDLTAGGGKVMKVEDLATDEVIGVVTYEGNMSRYHKVDPSNDEKRYSIMYEGEIYVPTPTETKIIGCKILNNDKTIIKVNVATGAETLVPGVILRVL
jgi:hypothetical protein